MSPEAQSSRRLEDLHLPEDDDEDFQSCRKYKPSEEDTCNKLYRPTTILPKRAVLVVVRPGVSLISLEIQPKNDIKNSPQEKAFGRRLIMSCRLMLAHLVRRNISWKEFRNPLMKEQRGLYAWDVPRLQVDEYFVPKGSA